MIELNMEEENKYQFGACLKVIGVGGAGGNAVNSMVVGGEFQAVDFIVANTDAQALRLASAPCKIQLGAKITKGLGAGSNPDLGRRAAEEDLDTIVEQIMNADILFLTAGLGGGTGTGALPVITGAAKELGILTVAVVTKPFLFEGKRRLKFAEDAIRNLRGMVDTLIIVPNQRLLEVADPKISMLQAFAMSDDILKQAIKGISDIITKPGHINVDFADVKAIMKDMGMAIMGTGKAQGEGRARKAALNAIGSPLLENVSIAGARGVLINISGNQDLGLHEINEAATLIYEMVSEDANIILGSVIDDTLGDDIMVTVIATGFDSAQQQPEKNYNVGITSVISRQDLFMVQQRTPEKVPAKGQQDSRADLDEQDKNLESALSTIGAKNNSIQEDRVEDETEAIDLTDLDTPAFLRKKNHEPEKTQ